MVNPTFDFGGVQNPAAANRRRVQLYPLRGALRFGLVIGLTLGGMIGGGAIAPRVIVPARSPDMKSIAIAAGIPIALMILGFVIATLIDRALVRRRSRFLVIDAASVALIDSSGKKLDAIAIPQVRVAEGYHVRVSGAQVGRPFHSLHIQFGSTNLLVSCNSAAVLAEPWGDFEAFPTRAVTDDDYMFLRARLLPHRAYLNVGIQQAIASIGRGDQAPLL